MAGGTFPFGAHQDGVNQQFSILGVAGSLGTADTGGTARTLPVGVRESNGALYVYNVGPAGNVTVAGTDPTSYMPARLTDGTSFYTASGGAGGGTNVNVVTGTINVGTSSVAGRAASGAAAAGNPVLIAGTDSGGTVYAPLVTSGGALTVTGASAGTFVNISTGTLTTGSIVVTTGTINTGTVVVTLGTVGGAQANAAAQSGNPLPIGGTDSGGTVRTIKVDSGGLQRIGLDSGTISVLPNLPQGSINVTAGTITAGTLTNLTSGTINSATVVLNSGTINVGTVTARLNPLPIVNTISHAGTSGTTAIGTLIAAQGAGTTSYVTGFHVLAISGTPEVILAFGSQTNGPQVICHGLFPAGGGISKTIHYPHGYGTSNSAVTYQILSGAGTVAWDVDYFNSV